MRRALLLTETLIFATITTAAVVTVVLTARAFGVNDVATSVAHAMGGIPPVVARWVTATFERVATVLVPLAR